MKNKDYFQYRLDYMPWYELTEEERAEQTAWQETLAREYGASFGEGVFVSKLAHLYGINQLEIGDKSFLAADCLIREAWLTMGKNCSINSNCYLQGKLRLGNDVRVAPGVQLIAMNHIMDDPTIPITQQGLSHKGITIEDDVWIGAGTTVVDGVTIGAHSVVGAGAVVTKNIPAYRVAVGNPARVIRDRRHSVRPADEPLMGKLAALCEKAHTQLPELLQHYTVREEMRNAPDAKPTVRACCDAVELMGMLERMPDAGKRDVLVRQLRSMQKTAVDYDVLSIGYALEVLGAAPKMPFEEADSISANLESWLAKLPWKENPWGAGAEIDHLTTAWYLDQRYFGVTPPIRELLAWLTSHQNPDTGLWGEGRSGDLHLPVNGYYRLVRGSFAQFGVPVPRPETTIDSLLRQAARPEYFGEGEGNACDVLDIVHPLWLCARQTDYRRGEGQEWMKGMLPRVLSCWQENRGFAFELSSDAPATLQGTEMWLSILWLMCDYLDFSWRLTYCPKGVHRPKPAVILD